MIEVPPCHYAVAIGGNDMVAMTGDKLALHEWLTSSMEGKYFMVASPSPMSLACPATMTGREYGNINAHTGAIFFFEKYNDAFLFKVRFANGD